MPVRRDVAAMVGRVDMAKSIVLASYLVKSQFFGLLFICDMGLQ